MERNWKRIEGQREGEGWRKKRDRWGERKENGRQRDRERRGGEGKSRRKTWGVRKERDNERKERGERKRAHHFEIVIWLHMSSVCYWCALLHDRSQTQPSPSKHESVYIGYITHITFHTSPHTHSGISVHAHILSQTCRHTHTPTHTIIFVHVVLVYSQLHQLVDYVKLVKNSSIIMIITTTG